MNIKDLKPERVWNHFYSLTQIPRPSKKEERAVLFLEKFGKELGLETIKDELGNIIIRKPAPINMAGSTDANTPALGINISAIAVSRAPTRK